ncbi:MAG: hypothetical protein ACK4YP_19485, partial [Myxococcota bacterium]
AWTVLLALDAGERRGKPGELEAWNRVVASIARGDLVEAANSGDGLDAFHRWMIAGSDGATTNDLELARPLVGEEELGGDAVWVALALLAREGQDRAAVEAIAARTSERLLTRLRPVLDAPSRDAVVAAVDAAVVDAPAHERGWARLVGGIRLGDEAPVAWRREARALLLPWERPYVRGDGAVVAGAGDDAAAVEGGVVGGVVVPAGAEGAGRPGGH